MALHTNAQKYIQIAYLNNKLKNSQFDLERRLPADRIPLPEIGLKRLESIGLDVEQILRIAGIPLGTNSKQKKFVSTKQYFDLWRALETVSGDALIGLRIGGYARSDQFDPATFAALHSDNFGQALLRLARYKRLSCPELIQITLSEEEMRISFQWLFCQSKSPPALVDSAFANIHLLLKCGSGKTIAPLRVELNLTSNPIHTDHIRKKIGLEKHFGCIVNMNAHQDALVYHRNTFDECFITSNSDVISVLLLGLEAQTSSQSVFSLEYQVKTALSKLMQSERPSVEAVARDLCITPRTLQRRLTDLNTSYQKLLNEVRADTAQRLLANSSMEAGELAYFLGFEEVNSFQRAFHKWLGMTPAQWRVTAKAKTLKNEI